MPRTYLIAALIALSSVFLTACGNSNTSIHSTEPASINVVGEGEVRLEPDQATLTLTVVREAEKAEAALEANSRAMNKVLAAMAEQGVPEADLRTSNFNIHPKYVYPKQDGQRNKKPRIVGYTVRNSLTVTVRELDELGEVLQKSVELGVNEGGNIQFGNSDPQAALSEARALAMKDAKARARTLAKAADVELGALLNVTEQQRGPQYARKAMAAEMAMDAVPVAAGENSYRVSVNASYSIDQ